MYKTLSPCRHKAPAVPPPFLCTPHHPISSEHTRTGFPLPTDGSRKETFVCLPLIKMTQHQGKSREKEKKTGQKRRILIPKQEKGSRIIQASLTGCVLLGVGFSIPFFLENEKENIFFVKLCSLSFFSEFSGFPRQASVAQVRTEGSRLKRNTAASRKPSR